MSAWFRPKRYGWGASPANWKGWLAIGVFLVLVLAVNLALAGEPLLMQLGALGVLLALFAWIVWKKTEGDWRWRWGPDGKEK
ncbi:MAG: hypothetical protein ACLPX9_13385 [Rhodomicrobium sp.]